MRYLMLLMTLLLVASCATLEYSRSVDVAGKKLVYAERGQGQATIVLEAGLGDNMTSWKPVIEPLARQAKVIAYNRAGYAPSGVSWRSRTPDDIVDDLRNLLAESGNRPPYLLVGHSLGGIYMLRFAERYPEEVTGVVLVDSRHPMFTQACLERQLDDCRLPRAMRLLIPSHVLREYDGAQPGRMPAAMGDMPLAVLSRSAAGKYASVEWMALWSEMQLGLSELSSRSRYRVVENAGHYIHKDQPEAVLQAVAWVMNEAHAQSMVE